MLNARNLRSRDEDISGTLQIAEASRTFRDPESNPLGSRRIEIFQDASVALWFTHLSVLESRG